MIFFPHYEMRFRSANFLACAPEMGIICTIGSADAVQPTKSTISRCLLHPPPLVDSNPSLMAWVFFRPQRPLAPFSLCQGVCAGYNRNLFRIARGKEIQRARTNKREGGPAMTSHGVAQASARRSVREQFERKFSARYGSTRALTQYLEKS